MSRHHGGHKKHTTESTDTTVVNDDNGNSISVVGSVHNNEIRDKGTEISVESNSSGTGKVTTVNGTECPAAVTVTKVC